MYLLRCPQGHEIPVAAKAAGGTVACPVCGEPQTVPKLGELRQLPQTSVTAEPAAAQRPAFGTRIAFAVLMFIALAAAGSATFAAFRWRNLPVPITVEEHIEASREIISQLTPDQLVEVWQQYEQHGLHERQPYPYQVVAELRSHWKTVCLTSLAIAVLCVLLAAAIAWVGRGRKKPTTDT